MTDARAEAAARVGDGFDVRVLEPSPPAVSDSPYFADDPTDGGDLVPVERAGATSWARLCAERGDSTLAAWCADRWLVRHPLGPLPDGFEATRRSLHAVAEHLLCGCRYDANGKIGLRYTYRGFGTPFFGADRQVRVEAGELVDGEQRSSLTTLRDAGELLGRAPGAPAGLFTPTTPLDLDRQLDVDIGCAGALGDWYGLCASLLEQLRTDAGPADAPARVQIWPEHFDIAVDLGPEGGRANYGGSPGDDAHPEPYLYVGPWGEWPRDPFWNEPFGASLSYRAVLDGADPLAFFRRGKELLA